MLYGKTAWWLGLALACTLMQPLHAIGVPGEGPSTSATSSAAGQVTANAATSTSPLAGMFAIRRYEGAIVRDVQFRGFDDDPRVMENLRDLISQRPGEPLDRSKIRKSIEALYKTGRFASIQAEVEPTAQNELRLVFVARNNLFVGGVTVTGNPKRPNATQLVNASKLQLGELFTREKLSRAIANIRSVLATGGYYRAEIDYEEEVRPAVQQVLIHFRIVPNPPARVGKIIVQGNPGYSPAEIEKIAHIQPGDIVTAQRMTNALQNLRKRYQKAGRLEAQVSVVDRKYNPDTNRLDYLFDVDRGPKVNVVVEGMKLSKGVMKKYIPIYEENAVDDDLLNEGRRNLRDYLQTQGYFDAEVSFSKEYDQPRDQLHVIYTINRQSRHKLGAIRITGNKYFTDDLIRERLGIRVASGFMTNGMFSQSQLNRDTESIENLYKSNGFMDVKVKGTVQQGTVGNDDLRVLFEIVEGPQTKVAKLDIQGNKSFPTEEIKNLIQTAPGQPYSDANVATDRDVVVNYYYNHGFPNIEFESASKPANGKPNWMDVVFMIKEGEQVFVNKVLISGTHFTRPYVVNREMQVHPGDPLSQMGMLDTQRRLYDLGIFNEVDMAVQNPDGDAKYKDVLFQVREARRWTFNYGLGLEIQTGGQALNSDQINTAPAPGISVPPGTTPPQSSTVNTANPQGGTGISPRISFDVTRLNFRGRDHTLLFKSHLSQLSRRALLSYDAPRWFDIENLRLTFTAFADNSRDVRTFSSERIEGSVQAEQVMSKTTTLLYRFQYRLVKVDSKTLVISPELVPLYSKPVRVGLPSFTYIRDKRDDPIDTHKGNYTTFDTGVAAGAFGSAANFGRLLLQNSTYAPIKKRFVLARSTRIGVEEPFGTGDSAIVPLPERFYAGGSQLLRGFALNQAGPRDLFTGFPVGGNAVFVNQVELRLPPFELPFVDQNLNFVLFHDSGNVFESGADMVKSLLRWYQPRREVCTKAPPLDSQNHLIPQQYGCDFNYMSNAAGIGARYKTPVGPIRLDFSYNFNPPTFPYYVQCPATPPSTGACAALPGNALLFQSGTLRHFNFSFSIGQTF